MELISDDIIVRKIRKPQYGYYREVIKNHVEEWKRMINESSSKQIEVRMRYIRDNILGGVFKDKHDITVYSRIKDILLEYGIKVKLSHHYGARLIMTNADHYEDELELNRVRRLQTAKNAGFNTYFDYHCSVKSWKETGRQDCDKNIECPKFLGNYMANKVLSCLFDGEKNPIGIGNVGSGPWDWKTKEGLLIKHCASSFMHNVKIDRNTGKEYKWEGWHWLISRNNIPDYFLLVGYGESRENIDIYNMWLIPSKDRVRRREFWDRQSFSIRTDKKNQIIEMQQYEVGIDKLEKVRNFLKNVDSSIGSSIRIDDIQSELKEWYDTYFRSW